LIHQLNKTFTTMEKLKQVLGKLGWIDLALWSVPPVIISIFNILGLN